MVNVGKTVHHADTDFGTIFCLATGLAFDYRTHMRLEDADDAVKTGTDIMVEHVFLLFICFADCRKVGQVPMVETEQKICPKSAYKIDKTLNVFI